MKQLSDVLVIQDGGTDTWGIRHAQLEGKKNSMFLLTSETVVIKIQRFPSNGFDVIVACSHCCIPRHECWEIGLKALWIEQML